MQINTVHVVPLHLIEIIQFGLRWIDPFELLMQLTDTLFQIARLIAEQTEFRNITVSVFAWIVITQFR
jgi:hypothetical protein